MGIQGLLPLLKSIMSPINIKDLEGCCVAVDTYSWLHKGALSCSTDLCKGIPTSRHIDYCMHRVNLLRHYGVKPILVFDGGLLPMKTEQENKRARSRKENLARALEHESSGNSTAAYECYQKAVDISPAIAYELIQVLKREGVCYIVAPYEADAQMTFLTTTNQVDAVITEDSDLIAFGCPRVIYKMDKFGQGVEFQLHRLHHNRDLAFMGFTNEMLLEMCILSGCDYLPSLPGMGLKRAHALISKFRTFEKVMKHLRYSSVAVPPLYEKSFKKAVWTFRHQRVYDPNKEDIVHLSDISDNIDGDLDFLGPAMPQHIVKAIAIGELDPITKLPFQREITNQNPVSATSYQLKEFRPEGDKKKLDLPAQRNVLTNYFCFASLEAKRKFRVPRVSPKCSDSANESSLTFRKLVCEDATAYKKHDSSESSLGLVVSGNANSPHNSMNIEVSPKEFEDFNSPIDGSPGENPLEQPRSSIHKPCLVLRRERDQEHGSRTVLEMTNIQSEEATAGNSDLQHKSVDEGDPKCRSNRITLRSSYILDKQGNDYSDGKSKKVIIRSSYFKRKSNETSGGNESDRLLVKDDFSVDGKSDNTLPETATFGNNLCEDLYLKRKASPSYSNSEELVENKHPRTETSAEAEGIKLPTDGDKSDQIPEEKKFGSNISHLGHYSDIAGKSMDKFVSVISSFRFTSSGSRASGLRPPLRDVQNICPNRSPASIDIGKFSYVPSNGKATRQSRRS